VTVSITDLRFAWPNGNTLLDIEHWQVKPGESVFLYGPSGSGKSTFLALIAGMSVQYTGQVQLLGRPWSQQNISQRDQQRADSIGFIFQQFNLLPYLSALQNVQLALRLSPRRARQATADQAAQLLTSLGIEPCLHRSKPAQLSVGQQQRVAAARALIGQPPLILADEPTSALDWAAQQQFLDVLQTHSKAAGSALIYVSHDERLAHRFLRQDSLMAMQRT
jgi:putative ABC transport system ATP-binding protein